MRDPRHPGERSPKGRVDVLFRVSPTLGLFALFPKRRASARGFVRAYRYDRGFGELPLAQALRQSRPATPREYAKVKRHLERVHRLRFRHVSSRACGCVHTAGDPKLDKKALWKQIEREERKKKSEHLAKLRAEVKRMRALKKHGAAQAKALCASGRKQAKRAAEVRRKAAAKARAVRLQTQGACKLGKAYAKGMRSEIDRVKHALSQLQTHRKSMRQIARSAKGREAERKRGLAKAHVRRQESDDEVRSNIDASLVPLFDRVRRSIKGSTRMSRTEAFEHYVQEHPHEVTEAIEDKTDALIAELERRAAAGY